MLQVVTDAAHIDLDALAADAQFHLDEVQGQDSTDIQHQGQSISFPSNIPTPSERSVSTRSKVDVDLSSKAKAAKAGVPFEALARFAHDLEHTTSDNKKIFDINQARLNQFLYSKQPSQFPDIVETHTTYKNVHGVFDYYDPKDHMKPLNYLEAPECQPYLGPRSRFGDGDGSYWDKWLNADNAKNECLSPSAPFLGFKRFYNNKREPVETIRASSIAPYSVRNAARKAKEACGHSPLPDTPVRAMTRRDMNSMISTVELNNIKTITCETSVSLMNSGDEPSPSPKKMNRSKSATPKRSVMTTDDVTATEKDMYFGDVARSSFFDFYRQLDRQRYSMRTRQEADANAQVEMGTDLSKNSSTMDLFDGVNPASESTANYDLDVNETQGHRKRPMSPIDGSGAVDEKMKPRAATKSGLRGPSVRVSKLPSQQQEGQTEIHHVSSCNIDEFAKNFLHPPPKAVMNQSPIPPSQGFGKGQVSPRSKFVSKCVAKDIFPKPNILIRKTMTSSLNLSGQGMGDTLAAILADSLDGLPFLETLNISNNCLTDKGLMPIIEVLPRCPTVTHLDISLNKVDSLTARMLGTYLTSPNCGLIDVIMQEADIDDIEASSFVQAVARCQGIRHLDMSGNLLGSHEILNNVVAPHIKEHRKLTVSGDVFGDLLVDPGCHLTTLKLAWNKIRLQSGVKIADSLRVNTSLTTLDLSFNKLGEMGGESLGDALQTNKSLVHINIASNEITPRACFTICSGAHSCLSLRTLNMSNNPIGLVGAQAVVQIRSCLGDEIDVNIVGCSVRLEDASCFFNYQNLDRIYALDMSVLYERAVLCELLRLAALYDENPIKQYTVSGGTQGPAAVDVELLLQVTDRPHDNAGFRNLNKVDTQIVENCSKIDADAASSLFAEFDQDNSGALSQKELIALFTKLGIENSFSVVGQMLAQYDIDGSGQIEESELIEFVGAFQANLMKKIEKNKKLRFLSSSSSVGLLYTPPDAGKVKCEFVISGAVPAFVNTISNEDTSHLLKASKTVADSAAIMDLALSSVYLLVEQAVLLYHMLLKESGDSVAVVHRLLPRLATPADARNFISQVTKSNIREKIKLKQTLGVFYRPFSGNPNGFYKLVLSNPKHYTCFMRLVEYNAKVSKYRLSNKLGDLSQFANWVCCFRNVVFDGKAVTIDAKWLAKPPAVGVIQFDFVDCPVIQSDRLIVKDVRLSHLLRDLDMMHEEDEDKVHQILVQHDDSPRERKRFEMGANLCSGCFHTVEWCYQNYHSRGDIDDSLPNMYLEENVALQMLDVEEPSKSTASKHKKYGSIPILLAYGQHLKTMDDSNIVDKEMIAMRANDAVEDALNGVFLTCSQLEVILTLLKYGHLKKDEYGTYRVELIITLISNVVDVINFEQIYSMLTAPEIGMLHFRLGFLHQWNPLKPEGYIRLNLSRREEKQIMRMYLVLLSIEGAGSVMDITYRTTPLGEPFPEWKIPDIWYQEAGFPNFGVVGFNYRLRLMATSYEAEEEIVPAPVPEVESKPTTEPASRESLELVVAEKVMEKVEAAESAAPVIQASHLDNKARLALMAPVYPCPIHLSKNALRTSMERAELLVAARTNALLSFSTENQKIQGTLVPSIWENPRFTAAASAPSDELVQQLGSSSDAEDDDGN